LLDEKPWMNYKTMKKIGLFEPSPLEIAKQLRTVFASFHGKSFLSRKKTVKTILTFFCSP
jgi:hypothetical protein